MDNIKQSNTFRNPTVKAPVGLVLDINLNMLVTVYENSPILMQQRDLAENMTGRSNSFTKDNAQPNYLYIYNTSFSSINNMSLPQGSPQLAV